MVLATIGAIMSLRTLENSFDNNHQRLGLALYAAMWLQFLTGVFRPSRYIHTAIHIYMHTYIHTHIYTKKISLTIVTIILAAL